MTLWEGIIYVRKFIAWIKPEKTKPALWVVSRNSDTISVIKETRRKTLGK